MTVALQGVDRNAIETPHKNEDRGCIYHFHSSSLFTTFGIASRMSWKRLPGVLVGTRLSGGNISIWCSDINSETTEDTLSKTCCLERSLLLLLLLLAHPERGGSICSAPIRRAYGDSNRGRPGEAAMFVYVEPNTKTVASEKPN